MKGKLLKTILYLLLTLGAVTMVFPFFWMLATSFKSSLEVLAAQIRLIPELKKYVRLNGKLEEVEFWVALELERLISTYEGRITQKILGEEYLHTNFGSQLTSHFARCRGELARNFQRYPSPSRLKAELEEVWNRTVASIPALPSAQNLPREKIVQIEGELKALKTDLQSVSARFANSSHHLVEVVVLAGGRRGEKYSVDLKSLVYKRFLWSNFRKAWQAAPFARYFLNSIIMSVAVTIGQVLTSALAAYAFARMQFRFKEAIFLILLGTMMVPKQVILIPDYVIISELGWINTYYALIIPFIAAVFGIYFMRQHFETIPQDLFDAASIDGCGRFRTLFQIVLPLSRSVILTVALFTFIMTWNSLLWPLVMTNSPEMRPLQVGLAFFNQESGTEWELLMAASTFTILPLLIIFFVAQKQFIEGITRSGMKG